MADEPILEVKGLNVDYGDGLSGVCAVDNVSLTLRAGEFLAIVGESGCGKSTLCFAIAQLLPSTATVTAGEVRFKGRDLVGMQEDDLRPLRWREFSLVMQSAMNALNPVLTIGAQFRDAIAAHEPVTEQQARSRAEEALRALGVDPVHVDSHPHQLSGGMRQRAMVAMAILLTPELMIMDEPTSALDVVAQQALMTQVKELQRTFGFAVIFVTHDMSLVARYSDRVAVMYAGQIVELLDTPRLFDAHHPYSASLLASFPSIAQPKKRLEGIPGNPPDLKALPPGCRFNPRCGHVMPECRVRAPALLELAPAEHVRCHLYDGSERQS